MNHVSRLLSLQNKEKESTFNLRRISFGARTYNASIGRFDGVDPLVDKRFWATPYNYSLSNPLNRLDPNGALDYPIVTITKQKTGKTADQRVLGYSGGAVTKADLYKVVVTDTEDSKFRMEFSVTRDAWVDSDGSGIAKNVAFEPKDGNQNHYTAKVMGNGYPAGNNTEALKLTQHGSEVIHAEPNQTSVEMDYRSKADVAAGVMIHVGGNYNLGANSKTAASEGCFGVCNNNNSKSNPSNSYSNSVLNAIQNQAAKSQTNPGKIEVIIQKRTGNEIPRTNDY
ncbi:hypothetical protein [Emticicia sp. TH156]|uniref:hypothetical protein n=1 Tax=Emticicia sp. TH156 TaxID=2067454 RepID=UPI000C75E7FB|nr:hypothetical protein [Emticicia sp. TH156]PLK42059.1 hypothetical protein C0V77_22880 [Emticicia sp. TH156]